MITSICTEKEKELNCAAWKKSGWNAVCVSGSTLIAYIKRARQISKYHDIGWYFTRGVAIIQSIYLAILKHEIKKTFNFSTHKMRCWWPSNTHPNNSKVFRVHFELMNGSLMNRQVNVKNRNWFRCSIQYWRQFHLKALILSLNSQLVCFWDCTYRFSIDVPIVWNRALDKRHT